MEVLIPPWVRPESPETIRIIDDATVAFQPAFGRGQTQRGIWADPRWGLRRRYRGLRSDEKSAILNSLNESRGQFNAIRVTPHAPLRGSFATSELLTNNTFASGTTGWSGAGGILATLLSVSDRELRVTRQDYGANPQVTRAGVTVSAFVPYVLRGHFRGGLGNAAFRAFAQTAGQSWMSSSGAGLLSVAVIPETTSMDVSFYEGTTTPASAGDYFSLTYTSLARCALVDNGTNLLIRSDAFDNAAWTKVALATPVAGSNTAPDGTSTAENVVETTANSTHELQQGFTIGSSVQDVCFCIAVAPGIRTWVQLALAENTGSTAASAYFNLSTGAVGTIANGANWANCRAFTVALGGTYYYLCIVARKTNAATSLTARVLNATGNGGAGAYVGSAAGTAIVVWRATAALSAVPVRLVQTTTSATTGTPATAGAIYTKGWPASTSGLLLTGDWIEWQGELKQLTAPVSSDASGRAYLQFRPGLAGSPADNDPIVVQEPFGRFIYPGGTRELENLFGIYSDCEMNLEEVYS